MLICIQRQQASVTREQPEQPVGRRECAANSPRNEQTWREYDFISCPFPCPFPCPLPPWSRVGRGGLGGARSTGLSTVWQHGPGSRGMLPGRLRAWEEAASQHVCSLSGCRGVRTAACVREAGWEPACRRGRACARASRMAQGDSRHL